MRSPSSPSASASSGSWRRTENASWPSSWRARERRTGGAHVSSQTRERDAVAESAEPNVGAELAEPRGDVRRRELAELGPNVSASSRSRPRAGSASRRAGRPRARAVRARRKPRTRARRVGGAASGNVGRAGRDVSVSSQSRPRAGTRAAELAERSASCQSSPKPEDASSQSSPRAASENWRSSVESRERDFAELAERERELTDLAESRERELAELAERTRELSRARRKPRNASSQSSRRAASENWLSAPRVENANFARADRARA